MIAYWRNFPEVDERRLASVDLQGRVQDPSAQQVAADFQTADVGPLEGKEKSMHLALVVAQAPVLVAAAAFDFDSGTETVAVVAFGLDSGTETVAAAFEDT